MQADGLAWLDRKRHEFMASAVEYQRGLLSVTLRATVGRTQFQAENENGGILDIQSRDYILRVADLVLGGIEVEPLPGDRIVHTVAGKVLTFEVMRLAGEQAAGHSDDSKLAWRIHTKLVSAA